MTYCNANADKRGKPTTTPNPTIAKGKICSRAGRLSLKAKRTKSASSPAIVARAAVRNNGLKSNTAALVAGNEPLKMTTPMNPWIQPPDVFSVDLVMLITAIFLKISVQK